MHHLLRPLLRQSLNVRRHRHRRHYLKDRLFQL
jgi:hypothetical protein